MQAAPIVPRGGIVKYGAENEMIGQSGMDPSTSLTQSGLWRALYDPLIATRADGVVDLDASLAEAFEAVDDVTIVFTVRDGVKFHDGTSFDAEAARFNLDRAVDTNIPAGGVYAAAFSVIESKDVLDARTLKFTLVSPNAALLTNLQERGGMMASPPTWRRRHWRTCAYNPSAPARTNFRAGRTISRPCWFRFRIVGSDAKMEDRTPCWTNSNTWSSQTQSSGPQRSRQVTSTRSSHQTARLGCFSTTTI